MVVARAGGQARTSAAALVQAGHVRVNGVREKAPGHNVKTGDVLTIGLDRGVRLLKVIGFASGGAMRPRRACSMSICRIGRSNYLYSSSLADAGRPEKQPRRRFASLAAFKFLRYATRSELTLVSEP